MDSGPTAKSEEVLDMPWQAWITLAVIVCTFILLYREKGAPDQLMLGAVIVVWLLGIITARQAIAGFSNSGLVTVGALFIVVQAVDRSRLLDTLARRLIGPKSNEFLARCRLCLAGFAASGFFNNTPLVALLLPIVRDWARSRNFAASKFLIPLSYATIMGGLLTIIGTSTNLLVTGLMQARGMEPFGFFAPAVVAGPVGLVGLSYLLLLAPRLLPGDRGGLFRLLREQGDNLITQLSLTAEFPYLGKNYKDTLSALGIPEDCLLEILRPRSETDTLNVNVVDNIPIGAQLVSPTSSFGVDDDLDEEEVPLCGSHHHIGHMNVLWGFAKKETTKSKKDEEEMAEGQPPVERLWGFTREGDIERLSDIGARAGVAQICTRQELPARHARQGDILVLLMSRDDLVQVAAKHPKGLHVQNLLPSHLTGEGTEFVEVVLSESSPLIGMDLANAPKHVQEIYGTPLIAVRPRGGNQGEDQDGADEEQASVLPPPGHFMMGDTLLILAPLDAQLPKADFIVQSRVGVLPTPPGLYDYIPLVLFFGGLLLAALGVASMVQVSLTLATVFTLGRWVPAREIRNIVDWNLLILIGAALGFSSAVTSSGLSSGIAGLVKSAGFGPRGSIALVFFVTMVTTELITNNAAAALGLPLAIEIANTLSLASPRPLIMTVMLAASTSYAIPIGYATNLMVMGPGGYTFMDFLKVGVPMDLIYWVGCSLLVPVFFPVDILTNQASFDMSNATSTELSSPTTTLAGSTRPLSWT